MSPSLPRYYRIILLRFALGLALLIVLLGGLATWGLSRINTGTVDRIMRSVRIMARLNELRAAFSRQHEAITYGLSKSVVEAESAYLLAQEQTQKALSSLAKDLSVREDLILLDTMTYAQTMFSEQVVRLFDYLRKRRSLSLTYDELTDLKSYPLQSLKDANASAERFQAALRGLEENASRSFETDLRTLVDIFHRGTLILLGLFGLLLLLLLAGLARYSAAAAKPFRKLAEALRTLSESDFRTVPGYAAVDDPSLRFVLRNISNAVSHFRNFLVSTSATLHHAAESLGPMPSKLRELRRHQADLERLTEETRRLLTRPGHLPSSEMPPPDSRARIHAVLGHLDSAIPPLIQTLQNLESSLGHIALSALNLTLAESREGTPQETLAENMRALASQTAERLRDTSRNLEETVQTLRQDLLRMADSAQENTAPPQSLPEALQNLSTLLLHIAEAERITTDLEPLLAEVLATVRRLRDETRNYRSLRSPLSPDEATAKLLQE